MILSFNMEILAHAIFSKLIGKNPIWILVLNWFLPIFLRLLDPPLSENEFLDILNVLVQNIFPICREKSGLKTVNFRLNILSHSHLSQHSLSFHFYFPLCTFGHIFSWICNASLVFRTYFRTKGSTQVPKIHCLTRQMPAFYRL